MRISFDIPDPLLDEIAIRVAEELERRGMASLSEPDSSPWVDVAGAATYLRCERQRIYDLVSEGKIQPARDGRRLLFRREWLDTYLTAEQQEEGDS